jgi:hypothetical protein
VKIDLYTKAVLTVIALVLAGMASQSLLVTATAQNATGNNPTPVIQCGAGAVPCYVQNTPSSALYVKVIP